MTETFACVSAREQTCARHILAQTLTSLGRCYRSALPTAPTHSSSRHMTTVPVLPSCRSMAFRSDLRPTSLGDARTQLLERPLAGSDRPSRWARLPATGLAASGCEVSF